jgi:hypothetical protein
MEGKLLFPGDSFPVLSFMRHNRAATWNGSIVNTTMKRGRFIKTSRTHLSMRVRFLRFIFVKSCDDKRNFSKCMYILCMHVYIYIHTTEVDSIIYPIFMFFSSFLPRKTNHTNWIHAFCVMSISWYGISSFRRQHSNWSRMIPSVQN